jgi:hypothetical protein
MSIAKLLIGQKPETKPSAQQQETVERPLTARELIDTIAQHEFLPEEQGVQHDTTGVGSPADGSNPETGEVTKHKGKGKGDMAKGKKTPGQVAAAPSGGDPVNYGSGK